MISTKFSLALGGGGARGLSHVGVLKYLEEKHLFPRALSGTSMGAIIACCIAIGKNAREIEQILSRVNWISLIDFDMKKGLISGDKVTKYLDEVYGSKTFRDTRMPLFITSTDINSGERIVITEGKLSDAVRASISLPGIFSPYLIGGRELVDGGLTANLPIELLPPGPVIAVSAMRDLTRKIEYRKKIFSLDWQNSIFTNSYNIVQKTIDIMLSQNESRSLVSRPDIISIRPSYDDLDYYEFYKYEKFIESGYRKAKEVLG